MKYLILALFAFPVFADSEHSHYQSGTNTYYNTHTEVNPTAYPDGIALGIAAAQHHFSGSTDSLQISVGVGEFNGSEAVSVGLARRYKDILVNGSIGREGDKSGAGVGFTLRLK